MAVIVAKLYPLKKSKNRLGFPPILSCQDHINESDAPISRDGIPEGLKKAFVSVVHLLSLNYSQ